MTSIRSRSWSTPSGEKKSAWVVDYRDAGGHRRSKQFKRKKEADVFAATATWELRQGTHTADSQSIIVAKAADNWLARGCRENLEASTIAAYRQHVYLHS